MMQLKKSLNAVCLCVFLVSISVAAVANDAPPLPLHGIEGMGGIFATYSAYVVNPAIGDEVFGLPSVGFAQVHLGDGRHMEAFTFTESIWGRLEFGYGFNHLHLGDLPQAVQLSTSLDMNDHSVDMHNVNLRFQAVKEGDFDQPWMPALTVGAHYKYNQNVADIDNDLAGTLSASGIEDEKGWDITLYGSKMITTPSRPFLVNAGVRYSKAAHLGLLGFTGKEKVLFEGNAVFFATDQLALAGEYRQKPQEYTAVPGLIETEHDWWTLCAAYVVTEHMTLSGGYGHFGDVLNHQANETWGMKIKWEL